MLTRLNTLFKIFFIFFISTLSYAETMNTTLDNGLKVVIKKDPRAPVVTSHLWYKIGSGDEQNGITGISHALEHMMFKGTEKFPGSKFSDQVEKFGGSENAFTSRDYTAYYQTVPKSFLEDVIKMESDRMKNLQLKKSDFIKEIEVIKEERRLRTDDQSEAIAYEKLHATAFVNNPYHNPVIGWMEDLETMEVEDLQVWYDRWYSPNNATVVIVGDVDIKKTLQLVKKYYGPIKTMQLPVRKDKKEPKQFGTKLADLKIDGKQPYLIFGYKVPSLTSSDMNYKDCFALYVLSSILSYGDNSRLSKELIRQKKLAYAVDSSYSLFARNDSLFLVDASPVSGINLKNLEKEIESILYSYKKSMVTKRDLDKILAQVIAYEVYQQDSLFYQAYVYGMTSTTVGSIDIIKKFTDYVGSVTSQDIMSVAKKYFVPTNKTVAYVNK